MEIEQQTNSNKNSSQVKHRPRSFAEALQQTTVDENIESVPLEQKTGRPNTTESSTNGNQPKPKENKPTQLQYSNKQKQHIKESPLTTTEQINKEKRHASNSQSNTGTNPKFSNNTNTTGAKPKIYNESNTQKRKKNNLEINYSSSNEECSADESKRKRLPLAPYKNQRQDKSVNYKSIPVIGSATASSSYKHDRDKEANWKTRNENKTHK